MIDRAKSPAPLNDIEFVVPKINIIKLDNGLEVYHIKKDKLPIVKTIFISEAGSKYDTTDKLGLTFLTSLLIDEGAGEYDALQLDNEIEKLGTIYILDVTPDNFKLSLMSLKENYERSLELLSKIIFEPRFEENDFRREKKKMLDKITQLKDEPSYIASVNFEKIIFNKTSYSFPKIGYEKFVVGLSIDDVNNFYKNIFLQANTKAIIVGNIEENEIIELFNKYFYRYNCNTNKDEPVYIPLTRSNKQIYFINKKDSAQSEIRIGHISKNRYADDYFATKIMNTILGGQFSSRINLNLREKKGFTYGASSSFYYNKNYGNFEVSTSVNIQNTGESISEILSELELIRKNISEDEINFAKSFLIKQFPSRFETYTQTANNIEPLILYSLPLNYYDKVTEIVKALTHDEIKRAALENIFPDEVVILVVGDKEIILPQLQKLYCVNPIELDLEGNQLLNF